MSSPPRLYPTDLSDAEWAILEPLIPRAKVGGRPRKWPMRTIMNGIFYVVRSGCQWRLVPREYPPWQTLYHYFRLFRSRLPATSILFRLLYRERHHLSGSKSDRTDARMLADLVRTDRAQHRPLRQDSPDVVALQHLTHIYKRLIWEQQRCANQLRETLREYYPAALTAVGKDLTGPVALALLPHAPTPDQGRRLSRRQLVGLLKRAGAERRLEERATTLWQALRAPQREQAPEVSAALGITTRALVAVLQSCARQIAELEAALARQFEAPPGRRAHVQSAWTWVDPRRPGAGRVRG